MEQTCWAHTRTTTFTLPPSSFTSETISLTHPQRNLHTSFTLLFPALLLPDTVSLPWESPALNTTYETSPYAGSHIPARRTLWKLNKYQHQKAIRWLWKQWAFSSHKTTQGTCILGLSLGFSAAPCSEQHLTESEQKEASCLNLGSSGRSRNPSRESEIGARYHSWQTTNHSTEGGSCQNRTLKWLIKLCLSLVLAWRAEDSSARSLFPQGVSRACVHPRALLECREQDTVPFCTHDI